MSEQSRVFVFIVSDTGVQLRVKGSRDQEFMQTAATNIRLAATEIAVVSDVTKNDSLLPRHRRWWFCASSGRSPANKGSPGARSDQRRVGKEGDSTGRYGGE